LKKNKDVRTLSACLDTATFINCHNVKFNATHFTFDRITKEFNLDVTPMSYQDILCFSSTRKRGMLIRVKSCKLRILFTKFFEQINKIQFCASCGNFAHSAHYYQDVDMCETCLFEEISSSENKNTEICSICQEESKRMFKTGCGHFFHRKCLAGVNPKPYPKCPMCRAALDPADSYLDDESNRHMRDELNDEYDSYEDDDEGMVYSSGSTSQATIIHEGRDSYR
jgi:hypothetical protein